ncbi:MAG: tryptophan synthase subunit beta [Myxococcota bacterium]
MSTQSEEEQGESTTSWPDARGRFGEFGGRYVSETLMGPLTELQEAFEAITDDQEFWDTFRGYLKETVGRPTPITFAANMTRELGGAQIWLKREDLCHTGAHKINNTLGQCLLAQRMGKKRIIAETGAGQHGVATATAAALLGLPCRVYMGREDCRRQRLNVFRMRLMGAEVVPVDSGSKTLKDAINEAMRHWVAHVEDTFYCFGSAAGPHPYPWIVRTFQAVIGQEARAQMLEEIGRLPDKVVACVGGGSNAIGLFHPFIDDTEVQLIGVEAGGHGVLSGAHAASITAGQVGVLHGARSYVLQDAMGQVQIPHSVSAGLDYPAVGPEHAWLAKTGQAQYLAIDDDEALQAFRYVAEQEGIIPALETAHAFAYVRKLAPTLDPSQVILIGSSGRGDKDVPNLAEALQLGAED